MFSVSTPCLFCIRYLGSSLMTMLFFIQMIFGYEEEEEVGGVEKSGRRQNEVNVLTQQIVANLEEEKASLGSQILLLHLLFALQTAKQRAAG